MNKLSKQTTASTTGLLIGLVLGFLIGLAMFKATPKSERSIVFPYAVGIGVMLTTIVGYKIGAVNDKETYRDIFLGIKHINTQHLNNAGEWVIQSSWKEYSGKENTLKTTVLDGEMVSIYNDVVISNHGYATNSRSASKTHEEVKTDLIQKLKDSFEV
ncbi:hypothetical protein [Pedobacter alpinus]|uniref:Uncharacterized protein n=1 Tax=Pedobacter alpinus TaxID=1590643 RepID=A0ABW5TQS5_9SPHI